MSVGTRYMHKWVYNAIEDIGVQVLGIGEVFYIANPGFGLGAYPLGTDFPLTPCPQRDYDAIEFNFRRRLANNWSFTGNFLVSRLYGNYSGLSNNGSESNRNSPNVTRLWDGLFMSFTEKGCPEITNCDGLENYGRIATDRPFQLKLQGTYVMPWGTSVGVNFVAQSGNLQTSQITYKSVPVQLYGTGDLGRSTTYTNLDMNFGHTVRLPRNYRMTLQFNVTNVFDQDFVTALFRTPAGATPWCCRTTAAPPAPRPSSPASTLAKFRPHATPRTPTSAVRIRGTGCRAASAAPVRRGCM